MRITIVGGPFLPFPPAPGGAVERIWHGLAEEFAQRGISVTIVCRSGNGQSSNECVNGVRYCRNLGMKRTSRIAINLVKDFMYSSRIVTKLPPADVIVTNTFWLPAILSSWNARAGRIAVHVARMPQRQYCLYPAVHRFQAVSNAIRDALVTERPQLSSRIRVFPNPIDTNLLIPPPDGRTGRSTRTILYTGRIHPEKGLDLLVAAFAKLSPAFSDLRLRLVGPWRVEQGGGGDDYRAMLLRKAAGAPVEFGEPVFNVAGLASIYQDADYYCYPSVAERGEAFGVAPLEAMATGLPTVVSNLACFRDFVTDGQTGLVFDHRDLDPVARLASTLRRVVTDAALAAKLSVEGVACAAGFSYPKVAELYLDDFHRMTRTGGTRRWAATRC